MRQGLAYAYTLYACGGRVVLSRRSITLPLVVWSGLWASVPASAESNWSGVYGGGSIGRRFTDTDWQTTCLGISCPTSSGIYLTRLATENPLGFDDAAARLGVFAGAQIQVQSLVFGVEADYGRAKNRSASSGIPGAEDPFVGGERGPDSAEVRVNWDASIRLRAGLLLTPQLMIYGTGGRAWVQQEMNVSCNIEFDLGWCSLPNVGKTERHDAVLEGWTWGAGLETLIDNHWMLRLEYRHSKFESMDTVSFTGNLANADRLDARTDTGIETFSIGLAYKF